MKKLLKIFGIVVLSMIFIIIALVIVASFSQNRIADITLKKISAAINAPVEIEDVNFTLIKRFPHATIELSGIRVGMENAGNLNPTNQSKNELLKIKKVYVSLKSIPLIHGEYEINIIEFDDASVNYNVDSLGKSNIDFLLKLFDDDSVDPDPANSATAAPLHVDLKKVKLKNTFIYYNDDSLKIAANTFFPALELKGKMANEKFDVSAAGSVHITNCRFGDTNLSQMDRAVVDFKLEYEADTLTIKNLDAATEGANLEVAGKVALSATLFTDLAIKIKGLELEKFKKYLPNELLKEYGVEAFSGKLELAGSVRGLVSDSIVPFADFAVNLENGFIKTREYPTIEKLSLEGNITNGSLRNNKTTSAVFKSFRAETKSSRADMTFSIMDLDKPVYDIKGKLKIKIEEFSDFIPDTLVQNVSGNLFAEFTTKGQMPDSIDDSFIDHVVGHTSANIDFTNLQIATDSLNINDFSGNIKYKPGHLSVANFNGNIPELNLHIKNSSANTELNGSVTQPDELEIIVHSFNTELPQGIFWGSAKIKNIGYPEFIANASAKIDLAALKPFLPDTLVKNLSGELDTEISTHGKLHLDSIAEQLNDIIFKQSTIELLAKNVSIALPDTLQEISGLNGEGRLEGGTITIPKMSGIAVGVEFSIDSTTVSNLYEAVIKNKNETVRAQGNFKFGAIDYSTFAPFFPADPSENTEQVAAKPDASSNEVLIAENPSDSSMFNFLFELKGKVAAKSFKYDKIYLEDISAKFNLTDSVYIIDQFKTKAFDGSTTSSLRYSLNQNDKQIINIKTQIDQMDIHKFLYAFDDFGYDSLISYKNVSGIVSANLNGKFVFDADTLVSNDMRVLGNFKLKNGKLVNYEPAMEVSKFTGLKELDNIEMKTLECNIFMFKNKLYVPITTIVSSSMDLSTFGMQSMGDDYEYHIQLRLSDVLKGKSQKLFERQTKSGDEVSEDDLDKNTIKLIYGYVDGKKKVGFATKKAQRQMALKIQVQETMLELIFHPKLVSFETGVK
jgi:uncharacterized protein involved in outer membrane biogenesis